MNNLEEAIMAIQYKKFKIGDIVRISPDYVNNNGIRDEFKCNAVYQGQSSTLEYCVALERDDNYCGGGAQNGWWNFPKDQLKYLEIVKEKQHEQS